MKIKDLFDKKIYITDFDGNKLNSPESSLREIIHNYYHRYGVSQYQIDKFISVYENLDSPYICEEVVTVVKKYNPNYGDDRICECDHPYYRHFDTYEDMLADGCKYCDCFEFIEKRIENGKG